MYEENKLINKAKVPQGKKAILFQRVFFIKSKRKGTCYLRVKLQEH